MDGHLIKRLRAGLGLTQTQLAEIVQVDQGTVSRWERGVERPRPRYLAVLRDLSLQDEAARHRRKCLAMLRNNVVPCVLLDRECRLLEISELGVRHYREKHGVDIRKQIGTTMESHADRVGIPENWTYMRRSGLLTGDAMLVRTAINVRGHGHQTLYEPIIEDSEVVGVFGTLIREVPLPGNDEVSVERFDVMRADSLDGMMALHRGGRAAFF